LLHNLVGGRRVRRTVQVRLRVSPAEKAVLEAARAVHGESVADFVVRLARAECAAHLDRPECERALLLLRREEAAGRSRSGRPPSPKPPGPEVVEQTKAPDPVRPGARFLHREWRWANGEPRACVILSATPAEVRFALLKRDGSPAAQARAEARDVFERRHVGRWL
jgi:hypothetical protein